ncbi:uncharacterized protein LOC113779674 isoform X1 [Coffea eugenioides]|uniref:uncharacterized protein LOC113779674 isoform X1 n=1 Tax=Coffea eugenioides TaxID=49369 RepID=UPI000F6084BC|nr:uncharacterized protein LOC113779674 isoform X1 [Coffea eugenioides]
MGSSSSPIASASNFSSIPFPNPRIRIHVSYHYNQKFQVTNKKLFSNAAAVLVAAPTRPRRLTRLQVNLVKCSSSSNGNQNETGSSLEDILSGMVDERVEQLFNKEENRVLLDGLEKATHRVEMAKKQLAEIQRQELEAKLLRDYVNKLQSTTSQLKIAECQKEILDAKAMVEEAERALIGGSGGEEDSFTAVKIQSVDRNEERLESVKAASISAIVGTLAGLPLSLTRITAISDLILPLGITCVSCALFGVTFRYAVRRNLDDIHLKSGTSAAFGVVKGLATLGAEPGLELDTDSLLSTALDGAVYVSENLLIFFLAGIGLDFCMKVGFLSQFPIDTSISNTNT